MPSTNPLNPTLTPCQVDARPLPSSTSPTFPESLPLQTSCPYADFYVTNVAQPKLYGLSVNTIAACHDAPGVPCSFKNSSDWLQALEHIKNLFPRVNAIRIDSVMESREPSTAALFLDDAMNAARTHNLSVVANVQGGLRNGWRGFLQQRGALELELTLHGCYNLAAVSVADNDLAFVALSVEPANVDREKSPSVDIIIAQMQLVRNMLRRHGCCTTPITHSGLGVEYDSDTAP